MATVSIQTAQARLPELIRQLAAGDEVVIVDNDRPVARLTSFGSSSPRAAREPGSMRGTVLYMSPDFDAPLDDFEEYTR